jgi:hypothetical protein
LFFNDATGVILASIAPSVVHDLATRRGHKAGIE